MTVKLRKFSEKELERLKVIRRVMNGELTQADAAAMLSLTARQVRRIMKRVKTLGDEGIIHKSKGRASMIMIQNN